MARWVNTPLTTGTNGPDRMPFSPARGCLPRISSTRNSWCPRRYHNPHRGHHEQSTSPKNRPEHQVSTIERDECVYHKNPMNRNRTPIVGRRSRRWKSRWKRRRRRRATANVTCHMTVDLDVELSRSVTLPLWTPHWRRPRQQTNHRQRYHPRWQTQWPCHIAEPWIRYQRRTTQKGTELPSKTLWAEMRRCRGLPNRTVEPYLLQQCRSIRRIPKQSNNTSYQQLGWHDWCQRKQDEGWPIRTTQNEQVPRDHAHM